MDTTELDLDYVRRVGEEVRARLFPGLTKDGRPLVPLPVALDYRLGEEAGDLEVLFVPERSIQRIDAPAPDVEPSRVRVVIPPPFNHFEADLEFGREPSFLPDSDDDPPTDEERALGALLRAVTGVL